MLVACNNPNLPCCGPANSVASPAAGLQNLLPAMLGGGNERRRGGLQDTPGLNSQEDVEVVLDYVRAQLQAYIAAEEDPRRSQPMSRLPDPRVDVVLYLVAPHALKPQDIVAMTRLSLLVPVVPLLAKVRCYSFILLLLGKEVFRWNQFLPNREMGMESSRKNIGQ
jgi:Septin